MNSQKTSIQAALNSVCGQYFLETITDGGRAAMVTDAGWRLDATDIRVDGAPLQDSDSTVTGVIIRDVTLDDTGDLHLDGRHFSRLYPKRISVKPPWVLTGTRGMRLTVSNDRQIDLIAQTGPVYATEENMRAWRSSEPTDVEYEVLRSAEDDWVQPGDVIGALMRTGMRYNDQKFAECSISTLAPLVARGDLIFGQIGDKEFEPSALSVEDAIEHIGTVWTALGIRGPGPGAIGWFDLTEEGRERLARHERKHPRPDEDGGDPDDG